MGNFIYRKIGAPPNRRKSQRSTTTATALIVVLISVCVGMIAWAQDQTEYNFGSKLISEQSLEIPWIIPISSIELVGDFNDYQIHWQEVAWDKWQDKNFHYMMFAENGLLNHDRQSNVRNAVGIREPSYGFCQLHRAWHSQEINDPRFFTDPEWQLEQCYRKWEGGTKFYGWYRFQNDPVFRKIVKSKFIFNE